MDNVAVQYLIAFLVVVVGLTVYWHLKWRARKKLPQDTFGTFFLAGERVGQELTAHNTWGLGFAFANAVWYFAYLGYHFGLWAFLLQLPWVISIALIAAMLRKYIAASQSGTVHGFIGAHFGTRAAVTAALATLTGYCLNIGFEMFYASHLLSVAFGLEYVEIIIAILIAVFVGAYCTAGGFYASVVTDKYQNIVGTLAIASVIGLLLFLPSPDASAGNTAPAQFETIPWHFMVGISVFAFFFNFVDMTFWQSLAANRKLPAERLPTVRNWIMASAAVQLFMPAFAGVWLGVIIKGMSAELSDDRIISFGLQAILQGLGPIGAVVMGFLVFGFLSLTLSMAGSYLVGAMQTLAVDVAKRREIAEYDSEDTAPERRSEIERSVLSWVKRNVIVASLFSVIVFSVLYYGLAYFESPADVFQFQFVMYGAAVTLVPVVLTYLLKGKRDDAPRTRPEGFWSIVSGLVAVLIPFFLATFFWEAAWVQPIRGLLPAEVSPGHIINLTPVSGLLVATLVFFGIRTVRRG